MVRPFAGFRPTRAVNGGFAMPRALASVLTTTTLLVATSAPALAQPADADSDRVAAERALDRSGRLRWMGTLGAGMSVAAMFMTDEQMASGGGVALTAGGLATLGLGVIGDLARHRARIRLDALDRLSGGGLDSPARAEAEGALRRGRQLRLAGDVGSLMFIAMPFFPHGHRCGLGKDTPECSTGRSGLSRGCVHGNGAGHRRPHQDQPRRESAGGAPQEAAGESPVRRGALAGRGGGQLLGGVVAAAPTPTPDWYRAVHGPRALATFSA